MSDIGLFPAGATAFFGALGLLSVSSLALAICFLVAFFRTRRTARSLAGHRFTSYAVGAAVTALASGALAGFIEWSGSLGSFSHWIDRTANTCASLLFLIALWPVVAMLWNAKHKRVRS